MHQEVRHHLGGKGATWDARRGRRCHLRRPPRHGPGAEGAMWPRLRRRARSPAQLPTWQPGSRRRRSRRATATNACGGRARIAQCARGAPKPSATGIAPQSTARAPSIRRAACVGSPGRPRPRSATSSWSPWLDSAPRRPRMSSTQRASCSNALAAIAGFAHGAPGTQGSKGRGRSMHQEVRRHLGGK